MTNKEGACTSAVSADSNKWLSKTGQSNYLLNEIYCAMEWCSFAVCVIIDLLQNATLNSSTLKIALKSGAKHRISN